MPGASDTQLQRCIDRMNAGDRGARDELVAHSCERLLQRIRTMLKDFHRVRAFEESGDILQESALRLQRALDVVPIDSVESYFRLAAQHIRWELLTTAQQIEKLARPGLPIAPAQQGSSHDTPPPALDPSDSTDDPAKLAIWREFHEKVNELPEKERATFHLVWYLELSHAEASAVLKVSVPAIKKRMWRARLRLQNYLE